MREGGDPVEMAVEHEGTSSPTLCGDESDYIVSCPSGWRLNEEYAGRLETPRAATGSNGQRSSDRPPRHFARDPV
jgi:hypothetical protein